VAQDMGSFADAMLRKLVQEVASLPLGREASER
jgi:hypothetical protein